MQLLCKINTCLKHKFWLNFKNSRILINFMPESEAKTYTYVGIINTLRISRKELNHIPYSFIFLSVVSTIIMT